MNRAAVVAARRVLPADRAMGRVARQTARRLGLLATRPSVRVINAFARAEPAATFVQVGANDGAALDPLQDAVARTRWTGVMVEPVPYVFARLQANMSENPRVTLANVAIADEDGSRDFFHLAEATPGDPVWAWYHALGSFNRDVLLSHVGVIPDIESRLVTTKVPCLTFDTLCERHGLATVDVVQIDTEGYDHVVLGLIDLDRYRPQILMYEHVHLDGAVRMSLEQRLSRHGYVVFSDNMDAVAVHQRTLGRHPAVQRAVLSARRELAARDGAVNDAGPRRQTRKASPKRFAQLAMFRLGYKIQRLNSEERAAFVQLQRPDAAAISSVFGSDAARLQELRQRYAAFDSPAADHSLWASRRSRDNLAEIGLAGVDLTRFRASSSYVWNYFGMSDDVAKLQYYVSAQAVKASDAAGLLDRLSEDGAFGCKTYDFDDVGRISRDLLDSVAEINFLQDKLGVLDHGDLRIFDIGAGYGRMAHRLLEANPRLHGYTCVDAVPESTFLCEFYLKHRGLRDRAEVISLDELGERLDGKTYDLALNIHSFSECTYAAVEWWLGLVRRLGVSHLMIVPNEEGRFVSTEVDGTRRDYAPLLAELGYDVVASQSLFDGTVRQLLGVTDRMYLFGLRSGSQPASERQRHSLATTPR